MRNVMGVGDRKGEASLHTRQDLLLKLRYRMTSGPLSEGSTKLISNEKQHLCIKADI